MTTCQICSQNGALKRVVEMTSPKPLLGKRGTKGFVGVEPHPYRVILAYHKIQLPLTDFWGAANVIHETEYKRIAPEISLNTYFFSHALDQHGVSKRSARGKIPLAQNFATKKRVVGSILRAEIKKKLSKRLPAFGTIRFFFPFPKEEVLEILATVFRMSLRGRTHHGVLELPGALDPLCADLWDVQKWQDGVFTFVTALSFTSGATEAFNLKFKISRNPGYSPQYREYSNVCFQRNLSL